MESLPNHPKQEEVIVYSKDYCPYCDSAKNLLTRVGVGYKEIDVTNDLEGYKLMVEKANNSKTVPQIFVGDTHVGGFDDLKALQTQEKLESLLFPSGR